MRTKLVYQGKYGATEQYAKWLADELLLSAIVAENSSLNELEENDLLIMGCSVYIGKLQLSKWFRKNQLKLEKLRLILFVVSGTPLDQSEKLNGYVQNSMPPGLFNRCQIFFVPGRLVYDSLSTIDRIMLRMGAFFAGKTEGAKMLTEYDDMKKQHLQELIASVKTIQQSD